MDLLTFITKVVDSLAWPVAIALSVLMLKEGIVNLIPKLKQIKYKELQLDFERSVKQVESEANQAKLPKLEKSSSEQKGIKEEKEKIFGLARSYPRAALLEAWVQLEVTIGQALKNEEIITDGEKKNSSYSAMRGGEVLLANHPEKLEVFQSLKNLRNKVAHGETEDVLSTSSEAYVELAFRLILFIRETWPNKANQL